MSAHETCSPAVSFSILLESIAIFLKSLVTAAATSRDGLV